MRSLLLCLLVALAWAPPPAPETPADTVFTNANVYTGNAKQPRAEAVAVRGGRIVFVGSSADARRFAGPQTKVVDLKGATVVPGLTDAHAHLAGIGFREMTLNLEGTTSLEDFLARVKARAAETAPGAWVTGRGWIETFWKPPVFPTRQDLDRVAPNNPVYLRRADGHGAVVNSKALEIAGITKATPNPFGGEIMHDKATGEPSGMILDNAQGLVSKHIPGPTEADQERAVVLGADRSVRVGWCQLQNAGSERAEIERIEKLYRDGRIKLRTYNAVYGPGPSADWLLERGPTAGAHDGRFTVRAIKVPFDGALGSKGAALLAPYADHDTSGFLKFKEEELMPMLRRALERGVQVETHAIGDRANRTILDYYEKAFAAVPAGARKLREPRWRVEHAQILDLADVPRFAKLGVVASMQPSHAISDLHFAPSRLGIARLAGAYAWRSLLASGAVVAGGSDAPVERGEPMIEFYAAVARRDLEGRSGEGWHPEQAVSREQALAMFTSAAAWAAFEEDVKGTIEVGKYADLTVLSADIMKIPAPEILRTRCLMTVIAGEVVFAETQNRPR
jgi:predicted amidohydrolase YtcJ